jgi:uncharacterized protein YjbI with pentapeptide repeats
VHGFGVLEGINSLVEAAKARARGYRSQAKMITTIYLTAAKLQLPTPHQPNTRLHVLTLSNLLKTEADLSGVHLRAAKLDKANLRLARGSEPQQLHAAHGPGTPAKKDVQILLILSKV